MFERSDQSTSIGDTDRGQAHFLKVTGGHHDRGSALLVGASNRPPHGRWIGGEPHTPGRNNLDRVAVHVGLPLINDVNLEFLTAVDKRASIVRVLQCRVTQPGRRGCIVRHCGQAIATRIV